MGSDASVMSAFFGAIHQYGQSISGGSIQEVEFENLTFLVKEKQSILFVISFDDDFMNENAVKLDRIADIFLEVYSHYLTDSGNPSGFPDTTEFGNLLVELNIAQRNCGGRPLCDGCPNARVLQVDRITESFKTARR
jgi:hypothetical protein